jgi:hypothetical protein
VSPQEPSGSDDRPGGVRLGRPCKAVDWIVLFSDLVLLVEVKSAIPTEPVRLGTPDAADEVMKLGKPLTQIDITARLIEDRDPALASVPADRLVLGMAVTLEPFHLANAPFLHDFLSATRMPVTAADAAEIEGLVTITDMSVGRLLLERAADTVRSTWSLDTALDGHARSRNPIFDKAWNSYPWRQPAAQTARSRSARRSRRYRRPCARTPGPDSSSPRSRPIPWVPQLM